MSNSKDSQLDRQSIWEYLNKIFSVPISVVREVKLHMAAIVIWIVFRTDFVSSA